MTTEEDFEKLANARGCFVGDRYVNPRGRVHRVVCFVGENNAILFNETSGREERGNYLIMIVFWPKVGECVS